jgi:hypothetical protein
MVIISLYLIPHDIFGRFEDHVAGGWQDPALGDPRPARLHGTRQFLVLSSAIEPCQCSPRKGPNASSPRKNFGSRRSLCPCRAAVCVNAQARQWEQRRLGKYRVCRSRVLWGPPRVFEFVISINGVCSCMISSIHFFFFF